MGYKKHINEIRKLEDMLHNISNDPSRQLERNVILKQLEHLSKKLKKQ